MDAFRRHMHEGWDPIGAYAPCMALDTDTYAVTNSFNWAQGTHLWYLPSEGCRVDITLSLR